jgi:hypothetical protein
VVALCPAARQAVQSLHVSLGLLALQLQFHLKLLEL